MHQSSHSDARSRTSGDRGARHLPARRQTHAPIVRAHEPPVAPVRRGFRKRRWTLLLYIFVIVVALAIFGATYTTYAFSRYQGLILPGVYVDSVYIGDRTFAQAQHNILQSLSVMNEVPIELRYGGRAWHPTIHDLALGYDVNATVQQAFAIGRTGSFLQDFIDRLPMKRHFSVALRFSCGRRPSRTACATMARAWVVKRLVPVIHKPMANAQLVVRAGHVVVIPSQDGYSVDVNATVAHILSSFGSLTLHHETVPLIYLHPVIGNGPAQTIQDRVERFLAHPPTLLLGRHHPVHIDRGLLASMISFAPRVTPHSATIVMRVDTTKLSAYVSGLAGGFDIPARNPQFVFSDGQVTVVAQRRVGRSMDQGTANRLLIAAFQSLHPGLKLRVPVTRVRPSVDLTNPASLGISTLIGEGDSSFVGAPGARLSDIEAIAARFNGVLIRPQQEISFNYYAGTGWPTRVYTDEEQQKQGTSVPGEGGAMQQVATTFFRAAYNAGLPVIERHAHPYRLPWYEPPIGMDAIVSPNGNDLSFQNTTGGYILVETRVEPIQDELYIYLYAPHTGWTVDVSTPHVLRTFSPGPAIVQQDPNLAPGTKEQIQFAHPGADVVVKRVVRIPQGRGTRVVTDTLTTHYQPWHAVILAGPAPTATPIPTPTPRPHRHTVLAAPTATPSPTSTLKPTATTVATTASTAVPTPTATG